MFKPEAQQKIDETISNFFQENPEAFFYGNDFPIEFAQKLLPHLKSNLDEEELNIFLEAMVEQIAPDFKDSGIDIKDLLKAIIKNPSFLSELIDRSVK